MGCGKCQSVGDHWQPKPMTRLHEITKKSQEAKRQIAQRVSEGNTFAASLATLEQRNRALENEIDSLNVAAQEADDVCCNIGIVSAPEGPETRARKSTLVKQVDERRNMARRKIANLNEKTNDANDRAAKAQGRIDTLKAREGAVAAERAAAQAELQRLTDAVANFVDGAGLPSDVLMQFARR